MKQAHFCKERARFRPLAAALDKLTSMALWTTLLEASQAALTLSLERLAAVPDLPRAGAAALIIVLVAGISETLGESVVLFINRVPPRRFVASLLVSGVIFAFTYLFLAASVYAVARLLFNPQAPFLLVATMVGVAFAPRMFGFLEFIPYFGQPLASLLMAWSLLALLAAAAALGADPLSALVAVVLGAVLLAVLQRTVGRPFGYIARRLKWATAGVRLRPPREALDEVLVQSTSLGSALDGQAAETRPEGAPLPGDRPPGGGA